MLYGQPILTVTTTLEIMNTTSDSPTSLVDIDGVKTGVKVCFFYSYASCSSAGKSCFPLPYSYK